MFLRIDPAEPEPWLVARVAEVLRRGGVAVIPTDTLYGIACSIEHPEAARRLREIKGADPKKPLALLLRGLADASPWTRSVPNNAFRLMKRVLPGPYTFILAASGELPKTLLPARKTIGVRVPASPIVQAVLEELGHPLLSTSVRDESGETLNEPLIIEERLGRLVDIVVDGGPADPEPSTIVDVSTGEPELLRAGKGDVDALNLSD